MVTSPHDCSHFDDSINIVRPNLLNITSCKQSRFSTQSKKPIGCRYKKEAQSVKCNTANQVYIQRNHNLLVVVTFKKFNSIAVGTQKPHKHWHCDPELFTFLYFSDRMDIRQWNKVQSLQDSE